MKAVASAIPEYVDSSKTLLASLAQENQAQPGKPAKLAAIILDLVRDERIARGKVAPFRLSQSTNVHEDIKAKCEETLKLLKDWGSVIKSTNFEEDVM